MHEPNGIEASVQDAIALVSQRDRAVITMDAAVDDLALDSMSMVAIATYLEVSLERKLGEEQIIRLLQARTIAEIVRAVAPDESR